MQLLDTQLAGYLLDSLDQKTHAQVEAYLRTSPEARERLERLREALAPLAEDRDAPAPPPDLTVRTLAFVAEHVCRELPRSPLPLSRSGSGGRPFWRRVDVLVAASLLFFVVGLAIPLVPRYQAYRAQVECANNLKNFHAALTTYHNTHGKLPNFAGQEPHKVAGLIAPLLNDAGVLPATCSIRCPANGSPVPVTMTVNQIQNLSPEAFDRAAPQLLPCYAYSLGYVDHTGYHFPNRPDGEITGVSPLMADRPPLSNLIDANSPNHGGQGQNVLYHDGHVSYKTLRTVGIDRDDIYLNRDGKVAPGTGPFDAVLAPSAAQP